MSNKRPRIKLVVGIQLDGNGTIYKEDKDFDFEDGLAFEYFFTNLFLAFKGFSTICFRGDFGTNCFSYLIDKPYNEKSEEEILAELDKLYQETAVFMESSKKKYESFSDEMKFNFDIRNQTEYVYLTHHIQDSREGVVTSPSHPDFKLNLDILNKATNGSKRLLIPFAYKVSRDKKLLTTDNYLGRFYEGEGRCGVVIGVVVPAYDTDLVNDVFQLYQSLGEVKQ